MISSVFTSYVFGFGIFRKHRIPFLKTQAPQGQHFVEIERRVVQKEPQLVAPIFLALDSLKSLEENGPVYVLKFKLFNDGILETNIIMLENKFDYGSKGKDLGTRSIQLSNGQMHLALQRIKIIANSKVDIKKTKSICGVIPAIDLGIKSMYSVRNFNSFTNTFDWGLQLVENTPGCWAKISAMPTENMEQFIKIRLLLNKFARKSIQELMKQ